MTWEVIDTMTSQAHAGGMDTGREKQRYDATLRVVMWLDALWSLIAVVVAIGGSLAVALLGLPAGARTAVGVTALVAAVFLALCGAITGWLLMARMNAGLYTMPRDLRVPLPRGMHPHIGPE